MKTKDVLNYFAEKDSEGNPKERTAIKKTAAAIDSSYQGVYAWAKKEHPPKSVQYKIEVLTGGELKAQK